jgi:hypothetical protein
MSAINAETRDFWQDMASRFSVQRPNPGKRVRVTGGRKHAGKEGTVQSHQRSKYRTDVFRYASDASAHLRDMEGRAGFVVSVRPDDGTAPFWVDADKVTVINEVSP